MNNLQSSSATEHTPLVRGRRTRSFHGDRWTTVWTTESTTPMTSRPHYAIQPSLRRVRSRSSGPSLERQRLQQHMQKNKWHLIDARHSFLVAKPSVEGTDNGLAVKPESEDTPPNPLIMSIIYGMINAAVVLPILLSFGAIIYRDHAFAPYMPILVKLTLVSGIVHQICFSTFSGLPFCVGQVQDAGLIFLSSMASHIVDYCQQYDDDQVMLATAVVSLSLCTALLGVGLVLIGRGKLAQYVQMLPTCVVGGYLAFIGWFCGVSGLGIMAGGSDLSILELAEHWVLILPGVVGGIVIYRSVTWLKHMAVLPTCILIILVLFYVALWWTGTSVEEATEQGWIRKMEPAPPLWHTWDYFQWDKVAWGVLPGLVMTEMSMIFVVALSSSLDVAAIELEMQKPLDYNGELQMVGLSNIVSGLTGGYTGSYIFSQSIFSLRAGITSRAAGYVLALCQFIILILPFPILHYVPNFFFGSLLTMICLDLMYEWLIDVRSKLTTAEYAICLGTFVLIQIAGVEYGILLGVALYLMCRRIGLDVGNIPDDDLELDKSNNGSLP